jgi:hypothetical protein
VRTAATVCSGTFEVKWKKEKRTNNERSLKCLVIFAITIKKGRVLTIDVNQIKVNLKSGECILTEEDKVEVK